MTITLADSADLALKIDALAAQVTMLTEEAKLARQRRERWEEFQHDAMPVLGDAMGTLSAELEALDVDLADLTNLLRRLVRMAPLLDSALGQVEMYAELAGELVPLGSGAMGAATARLATLDEKGYFTFAKGAARVADQIVTGFSDDDVEQLGDNVVLILQTIKEMTQPEIMAALHRMITAVHAQQRQIAIEPSEPPSLFQILRKLRDPEIRRGMARGLDTLRAVSEVETASAAQIPTNNTTTGGN